MSPRGRHVDYGAPMSPKGRHVDCGGPISPRGRHVDCGGPVGHERLSCIGHSISHDRGDYGRHIDPSDRLDRGSMGSDRLDYVEQELMYISHDRLVDLGPHDRFGPHDRLECGGPPLGPDCVGPDTNMNIMGKLGPDMRHAGHVLEEDDLKDEYSFSGYSLLQDQHRRPMPALTPADPDIPGFCAGCGGRILDRYYLHAVEKQWHLHCLTCSDCHFRLDSEITCFARDGHIYCKTDYYRRFAVKNCARCQTPISANELIMRAKEQVFHLSCFSCTACNRTLKSGEQYGLKDNHIYCRMDYELMFQADYNLLSISPGMGPHGAQSPGGGPGHISFYNGVGAVQKGRPRKRKSPMADMDGCSGLGSGFNYSLVRQPVHEQENRGLGSDNSDRSADVLDRDGYPHQTPRQKRVRTSFKHHQLRTMKSYFALNHNPDAKDLKQLAQKTGLSKRVLQVWFQNARAKYRRNLLKQQDSEGGGSKSGQSQDQIPGSPDGQDKEVKDSNSIPDLNAGSPALSDISSTPSLSDIHSSTMDTDHNSSSNNSISDLFTSTITTMN